MKNLSLAGWLCLLLVAVAPSQAQDRPNALAPGARALLFQMNDLLDLNFFEGLLAMKYHLSTQRAFRVGLGGNASTSNDRARKQGGFTLQAQYLLYPQPQREVVFYLGTGPQIGFGYTEDEVLDGESVRSSQWNLGLTGRLGVEWFVTEHISLMGEYGNYLGLRLSHLEAPGIEDEDTTDYFYSTSAKLGISAYF